MRDLRDPTKLGGILLQLVSDAKKGVLFRALTPHEVADLSDLGCPNYNANPSCIEKYGRPQDLPETPF